MIQRVISKDGISSAHYQTARSDGNDSLGVLILFALTSWISHFFYFRDFGLYEDDYAFIVDAMAKNASYLLEKLQYGVLFPQGRPVGFYCAAVLAFIGDQIGGLWADYLIGFVIVTLNSYLFYRLLKYTELEVLAVIGGLLFCLFPADTTKILLTHAFILQISLTFLLIASLCYLANRTVLSYMIILGSLLSYESAFMVFFGIPLFKQTWNRAWVKELARHIIILIICMISVTLMRLLGHESRASGLVAQPAQFLLVFQKILSAMTIGLNTSLSLFITAPFASIVHWNWMTYIAVGLCFLLFLLKFASLNVHSVDKTINLTTASSNVPLLAVLSKQKNPDCYLKILKFLLVGLVLSCLGYTLAFTIPHYPPVVEKGRLTSVHLAATIGSSLVAACLLSLIFTMAIANRRKQVIATVLSLYLACLVGYQFTIQIDFRQSWQNQRHFWTEVLANSPDLDERTTVLVVNRNLPQTEFILTHSWADPLILQQIVQSPNPQSENSSTSLILSDANWAQPPVLFLVPEDWQSQVTLQSRSWGVPLATWQGYWTTVLPESTIVLEQRGSHLVRLDEPITIQGQSFKLKPKRRSTTPALKPGPLFKYLIDKPAVG